MTDDRPHSLSQSVQKLRLGGIKFSEAQVRLVLAPAGRDPDPLDLSRILAGFAKYHVNLQQISVDSAAGTVELYLAEQDYARQRILIEAELGPLDLDATVVAPVGTLTLFPHGSRMEVLVKVIGLAGDPDLRIYALGSSLSALCLSTDLDRLDRTAAALLENFSLPEGHSPFRYEPSELDRQVTGGAGRIVETIARYSESVIKIYGSKLQTGLLRATVCFPRDYLDRVLEGLSQSGLDRFEMMGAAHADSGRMLVHLMVDPDRGKGAIASLRERFGDAREIDVVEQHDMELLFFHGPHFQDRYGVMCAAAAALAKASIRFTCAACTGTGIHLVAERGVGGKMLEALGDVFVVP